MPASCTLTESQRTLIDEQASHRHPEARMRIRGACPPVPTSQKTSILLKKHQKSPSPHVVVCFFVYLLYYIIGKGKVYSKIWHKGGQL